MPLLVLQTLEKVQIEAGTALAPLTVCLPTFKLMKYDGFVIYGKKTIHGFILPFKITESFVISF